MKSSEMIELVCAYAESAAALPFKLYADAIPTESGDAGCVRSAPSQAAERAHLDGTRLVRWQLSVYVRCVLQAEAREYSRAIVDALDGAELYAEDKTELLLQAESLPQYVEQDAKGATIYLSAFSVQYLQTQSKAESESESEDES